MSESPQFSDPPTPEVEPEAPPTPPDHPDEGTEPEQPEEPDVTGEPVEADDTGVEDVLPEATDDPPITED